MATVFKIEGEELNVEADACPACLNGEWQTCPACDGSGFSDAYRAGQTTPPNYVEICASNACELLRWLGYEVDGEEVLEGVLTPGDLRARCEKRLERTPANVASDLPRGGASFGRVVMAPRRMGYLACRAKALHDLATRAGDRAIRYY